MCNVRTLVQVICLSLIVLELVECYSFTPSNTTRVRRQAAKKNCKKPNFSCKSGECIDGDKECDGAVDCEDASDESNSCHRLKCPQNLFTCDYGACIRKDLECDGKPDCRDGSDENTPKCGKTDNASPQCKANQFTCSSGQCIEEDFKCDGKAECDDHSDEIKTTCWNVRCPGFTYKCKYGACVHGKAECNGIVDCFDGSDEDPTVCGVPLPPIVTEKPPVTPPPTTGGKGTCALPEHPESGKWSIFGSPSSFSPGMFVTSGTILKVECHSNHKLEGDNSIYCDNGKWSADIGYCSKVCSPRVSTATMKVTCIYKNKETENCTDAVHGTLAKFKCAPFYEDLALKTKPIHICQDGNWDQPKPNCVPVCGQKTVDATQLVIGGSEVKKGDYPWQVALYTKKEKELICGGSLLSQRIILTAAHCVTTVKGGITSKEDYIVAVGKYYRPFNDTRDFNEAQFSELSHMFVPEQYKGETQNYLGDIAVLITKKVFVLSRRVQPVCVDYGQNFNPASNDHGYVTGWGFTVENSSPSEVLKELKVPSVTISQCERDLPEDYQVYLTHDKLCAGYLNKGTSVCRGDSGGGLVFKHDGRYYVTGIVSLSPTSPTNVNGCDRQQYGLYTKVSTYINQFLLPKVGEFQT